MQIGKYGRVLGIGHRVLAELHIDPPLGIAGDVGGHAAALRHLAPGALDAIARLAETNEKLMTCHDPIPAKQARTLARARRGGNA